MSRVSLATEKKAKIITIADVMLALKRVWNEEDQNKGGLRAQNTKHWAT